MERWTYGRGKAGADRSAGLGGSVFLDQGCRCRDRALFDLAIDSKLRGCDVVKVRIGDIVSGGHVRTRAIVIQQKTGRPVQLELKDDARASLLAWLERRGELSMICLSEPDGSCHAHQQAAVRTIGGRVGHGHRIAM